MLVSSIRTNRRSIIQLYSLFLAESGDVSDNMLYQAELLMNRTKKESTCDWDNDWKMVTLFVGVSRMCMGFFSDVSSSCD